MTYAAASVLAVEYSNKAPVTQLLRNDVRSAAMTEYIEQAPVEYVPKAAMMYAAPPVTECSQQVPVEDV